MIEREKIQEWIARFNEGTLKGSDLAEFLALMEADPELRLQVRVDKLVNESLEDTDLLEFRKAIKRSLDRGKSARKLPGWLLLAASVLLVVATGSLLIFIRPWRSQPVTSGQVRVVRDSSSIIKTENMHKTIETSPDIKRSKDKGKPPSLLADHFRPLASLESLVGEATRAGSFRLKQPAFDILVSRGDTVKFEWEADPNANIQLVLVDNRGKQVFTVHPVERPGFDLSSNGFSPGLYYWKILSRSGLICVGKIKIN